MKLTADQARYVAKLSNLPINSDEEEKYAEQLSKILEYIDKLNEVDTSSTEPIYNVSLNTKSTREDKVSTSITQDKALQNAPKRKRGFFVTKGVKVKI